MTLWVVAVCGVLTAVAGQDKPRSKPPAGYQGGCTDAGCHSDYQERPVQHAALDSCDNCHEQTDQAAHKFKLTDDQPGLCQTCHDEFEGQVKHSPVADGECTTCHDPHAASDAKLLKQPSVKAVCLECHDDVTEDRRFVHGPVAAGACTACHNPHAAERKGLLAAEPRQACLKCHETLDARLAAAKHQHDPVTEGCTLCHDPHGGDNQMNLRAAVPALCVDCHDEIGELMTDAEVKHDALTQGRSCPDCHDPHSSSEEALLLARPMQLCLRCHAGELKSGEGTVQDIAKLLKDNPNHHGPVQDENCTACHQAHGGANFRLLVGEYPPEFYAAFEEKSYALCFECHDAVMMADAETDDATGFRNGRQNLHHLHVNRAVKGRTCRSCHEAHASRQPRHIREAVPFGEWSLPVGFEQTSTGGRCAPGCHRAYRYDRERPVVNLPE